MIVKQYRVHFKIFNRKLDKESIHINIIKKAPGLTLKLSPEL